MGTCCWRCIDTLRRLKINNLTNKIKIVKKLKFIALVLIIGVMSSCGNETPKKEKAIKTSTEEIVAEVSVKTATGDIGVGPITSITLGDIDDALVEKGKEVYRANCTACHKIGKRFIGPALAGVTQRRTPEWIMNMIMNPEEMVKKDPTAKALLAEYIAPMANQNITKEDARAILEFFRTKK